MPTSLFSEMDRGSNGGSAGVTFEEQRALQLAFELSMLGIPEGSSGCPGAGTGNGTTNDPDPLQAAPAVFEEARSKKSQNMTECVPVPSSEHVAEIVGRQGSGSFRISHKKIGRTRNAAAHFENGSPSEEKTRNCSAARWPGQGGGVVMVMPGTAGASAPRRAAPVSVVMMMVVVVDAFVGLRSSCRPTPGLSVLMLETRSTLDPREQARKIEKERNTIGCKIKALRAKTNTYIKTPVRGEEPVFVVTGRKEDVARAKREILSAAEHFSQIRASRKSSLGALLGAPPGPPATVPGHITIQVRVPYRVVGLVVGPKGATIKRIQHQTHTYIVTPSRDKEPVFEVTGLPDSVEAARREIQAHITLRTGTAPGVVDDTDLLGALCRGGLGSVLGIPGIDQPGSNSSSSSNGAFSSSASCSSSSSSSAGMGMNDLVSIWSGIERDEGLGESPSFESQPTSTSSIWSFPSVALPSRPSPPATASPASPTDSLLGGARRDCVVCGEKEVTAALVPCGHNLFCMDCGNRVCEGADPSCPVCARRVLQVLRIFS
ncbi:RNA-binding protein MEX3A [Temnothorax longispinosus]|uniref:RNA-binding protein MEX3A n=1 Tax=Temnothorax longispinosus TaxID=300112 RepID=A0A4S2KMB5_9HYME|nr:RNA-binding protein MEX3A [Temnothorax longispinosus]